MKKTITIATRVSPMAMAQTLLVKAKLETYFPEIEFDLLGLTTKGDEIQDRSLADIGGKGLFLKELEMAVLDGRADMAVHSLKDMPAILPEGLILGAVCARDDPRDALISTSNRDFSVLPAGSVIGTSSLRRECQLTQYYPHLTVKNIRGNLNTRLDKLEHGDYDGLIVATAGCDRLNIQDKITAYLPLTQFLPAIGQGVLALECREGDAEMKAVLQHVHHEATWQCVTAERTVSEVLKASCHLPIAAYAFHSEEGLSLQAMVGMPDASQVVTASAKGASQDAVAIGQQVADQLLTKGADDILARFP